MCRYGLNVWINPQPCPWDRDIEIHVFLYLILMQYFDIPPIQILIVERFSKIIICIYMACRCKVSGKLNECTYLNDFSFQCLKGLKANTLFCITKYIYAFIKYRTFIWQTHQISLMNSVYNGIILRMSYLQYLDNLLQFILTIMNN